MKTKYRLTLRGEALKFASYIFLFFAMYAELGALELGTWTPVGLVLFAPPALIIWFLHQAVK